jgi:tRNA nucleotidyltransferase (CCA-adding enzyme)
MADYIYLLENRLSPDQRNALRQLREAAREAEMILFLTGDAVRDLTSGHAVRELEVAVHGNALKLKKIVENLGGKVWGEDDVSQTLYLCFPGTVRVDVVSTHSVEYKKPGDPTYHFGTIQDDLRRRDFTVNAMAISLNEGSYGLLMDPLNGVADIEARALRLVSNYGFLEDPSLMIRATRYIARLGWELDPKTQTRYENAKGEDVIQYLSAAARSMELEQIGHEDDGLKVLQALEAEGWMKVLCTQWTAAKADEVKLKALHDLVVELLMQGVHPDISAAQMQLLTAKMAPKDLAGLKKAMLRPGFVEEWNGLDSLAAGFSKVLLSKENQTPSATFKLFTSYDPEAVLWLGFTTNASAVKERFNNFLKVWPEVRQRIPYVLMQEMRIRPELANYNEIVHSIFLELIDGKLTTPEEMRAFLEPYSPPAPPPQITIKRTRGKRGAEPKIKEAFDDEDEEGEDAIDHDDDLDDMGGDDDDIGLGVPKIDIALDVDDGDDDDEGDEDDKSEGADEDEHETAPVKRGRGAKPAKAAPERIVKTAKAEHAPKLAVEPAAVQKHVAKPVPAVKPAAPAKPVAHAAGTHASGTHVSGTHAAGKSAPAKAAPAKVKTPTPAKKAAPAKPAAKKATLKPPTKPAHKSAPKAVKKTLATKHAPKAVAKPKPHKPVKPAPKKPAGKPTKKR